MVRFDHGLAVWLAFFAICYFSFSPLWNFLAGFDFYNDRAIDRYMDVFWTLGYREWSEYYKNTTLFVWLLGEALIGVFRLSVPGILILGVTKAVVAPKEETAALKISNVVSIPYIQTWILVPISGIAYMFGSVLCSITVLLVF